MSPGQGTFFNANQQENAPADGKDDGAGDEGDVADRSSMNDSRASSLEIQDEEDLEYGSEVDGMFDRDNEQLMVSRCHNHGFAKLDLAHLAGKYQSKSAPKLTISQEEEHDQYFE
jgi:hypothetical protein